MKIRIGTLYTRLLWFIPFQLILWELFWIIKDNYISWYDIFNIFVIIIIIEFVTNSIREKVKHHEVN